MLVRLYALDCVDIAPLRNDLMARLEHHRDRYERYERLLNKRFPDGTAPPADVGKMLSLRLGMRHERVVVEWCEEALDALSAMSGRGNVLPIDDGKAREQRLEAAVPRPINGAKQNRLCLKAIALS